MNSRKFLIIGIIFLGVVIIGLASYNLFFARPVQNTIDTSAAPVATQNPADQAATDTVEPPAPQPIPIENSSADSSSTSNLQAISSHPALGLTYSRSGASAIFFQRSNGYLVESTLDGRSETELTTTEVTGLLDVQWSPQKDSVITTRVGNERRLIRTYFNLNSRQAVELNENIKLTQWSPDGRKIVYFYRDFVDSSSIAVADPDGTNWVSVLSSATLPQFIDWPEGSTIYFGTAQTRTTGSFYESVSLQDVNNSESLVRDSFNLETSWSPDGKKLLYSETDPLGRTRTMYRVDIETGSKQKIDLGARAGKCGWSQINDRVYCAVEAQELLDRNIIPSEFEGKIFPSTDTIWSVDFNTLEVKNVLLPLDQKVVNTNHIQVSPNEDYLIFISSNDFKAYSLRI